jgi:nitroimidazol reductase NimA-like FMN-containing flavoprotein (pyridoxamine 5'-phosphate oxidase superfamily)
MLEITEMSREAAAALLARAAYGHLGCARDGHPYVVPMNYAYEAGDIYFFTTEGTKTEFISANGEVCFQVEEVEDALHWRSVMATGRAERLTAPEELERAMQLLAARNPALAPALNRTKIGAWTRLAHIALYRIRPAAVYGRKTAEMK